MKAVRIEVRCDEVLTVEATTGRGYPKTMLSSIVWVQFRMRAWLYTKGAIQLTKNKAQRVAAPLC